MRRRKSLWKRLRGAWFFASKMARHKLGDPFPMLIEQAFMLQGKDLNPRRRKRPRRLVCFGGKSKQYQCTVSF